MVNKMNPEGFKKYISGEVKEPDSQVLLAAPVEQKEIILKPPQRNPVIKDMESELVMMGRKSVKGLTEKEKQDALFKYEQGLI